MAALGRVGAVLGVLGAAWLVLTLSVARDLDAAFRAGTARYETPALRPDALPAGDLTRGGLVSPPAHAPPRPRTPLAPEPLCTGAVDVVFTWVNGSDPAQVARLEQHHGNAQHLAIMYRDYGLLRFAVRSIEKNAPWARSIILFTNGQRPDWFNESAPRFALKIRVVKFSLFCFFTLDVYVCVCAWVDVFPMTMTIDGYELMCFSQNTSHQNEKNTSQRNETNHKKQHPKEQEL